MRERIAIKQVCYRLRSKFGLSMEDPDGIKEEYLRMHSLLKVARKRQIGKPAKGKAMSSMDTLVTICSLHVLHSCSHALEIKVLGRRIHVTHNIAPHSVLRVPVVIIIAPSFLGNCLVSFVMLLCWRHKQINNLDLPNRANGYLRV